MTYFVEQGTSGQEITLSNWWQLAENVPTQTLTMAKAPCISCMAGKPCWTTAHLKTNHFLNCSPGRLSRVTTPSYARKEGLSNPRLPLVPYLLGGYGPLHRFPHLWEGGTPGRSFHTRDWFCSGEKDTLFITFAKQYFKIALLANIRCVREGKKRHWVTSPLWFKKSFPQLRICFVRVGIWGGKESKVKRTEV